VNELTVFIIMVVATLLGGFYIGLLGKGIDRKIAAKLQARIGPPIRQGFWDLKKLMLKQTIVPENCVTWIFKGAPLVALVSAAMLFVYVMVPYLLYLTGYNSSLFAHMGDLILIIYLLMIPAIALVAGGFSAGSPLSTIGSQREMVVLMATELPLAITVVAVATKLNTLVPSMPSFSVFTAASSPIWTGMGPAGILGGILLASAFLFIIPAETGKIPFDQAEAETEIAEGLLAEYSGKYLAFFQLSEAFKTLSIIALVVVLFFPQGVSFFFGGPVLVGGLDITIPCEIAFFLLKISLVYSISISFIRISMARLKISQVSKFFIYSVSAVSITGFILILLDPKIMAM